MSSSAGRPSHPCPSAGPSSRSSSPSVRARRVRRRARSTGWSRSRGSRSSSWQAITRGRDAPPLPPRAEGLLPPLVVIVVRRGVGWGGDAGEVVGGQEPAGRGQDGATVADAGRVGQGTGGGAEIQRAEHGAASVGHLGDEPRQRRGLHGGVQRVRDVRDDPLAGGAADQVELVCVGGDGEVIDADRVAIRVFRQRDNLGHQPANADDVLVVHAAGRDDSWTATASPSSVGGT
jgi:hypothetical protein